MFFSWNLFPKVWICQFNVGPIVPFMIFSSINGRHFESFQLNNEVHLDFSIKSIQKTKEAFDGSAKLTFMGTLDLKTEK